MAERLGLGYLNTGIIVCTILLGTSFAWYMGLDPVLAFWIVYIMTRPLGPFLGDYMSQSAASDGLGFGPTVTSLMFLTAILVTVVFPTITKRDIIEAKARVKDFESARDNAAGRLQRMNNAKWTEVDTSIEAVLRKLRAFRQDQAERHASLQSQLAVIDKLSV